MIDWLHTTLPLLQSELRASLFWLTVVAAIAWVPVAWRALRGDMSSNAALVLGVVVILLGQGGFQSSYQFEGFVDVEHWRIAANLIILNIGCLLIIASRLIRRQERRLERRADEDA